MCQWRTVNGNCSKSWVNKSTNGLGYRQFSPVTHFEKSGSCFFSKFSSSFSSSCSFSLSESPASLFCKKSRSRIVVFTFTACFLFTSAVVVIHLHLRRHRRLSQPRARPGGRTWLRLQFSYVSWEMQPPLACDYTMMVTAVKTWNSTHVQTN